MIEACRREVEELHAFFEEWFEGRVEDDDAVFARVAGALGEDFVYIDQTGRERGREQVLESIRAMHGEYGGDDRGFRIEIRNFRPRVETNDVAVVAYEEYQVVDGVPNARVSTAVFRRVPDTPTGVEWVHLHEVTLPR